VILWDPLLSLKQKLPETFVARIPEAAPARHAPKTLDAYQAKRNFAKDIRTPRPNLASERANKVGDACFCNPEASPGATFITISGLRFTAS
jgi:hypothetical protein